MPDEPNRDRADRILDAAADLLVRWGSRKVTIDDIARRAGIGKGTVYLHWRTKDQLFEAVLMRASVRLLAGLAAALREDPRNALPHRYFRQSFLLTMRDRVLSAMIAKDTELLGQYAHSEQTTREAAAEATERTFDILTASGLLPELENQRFALSAAASGFYFYGTVNPAFADLPLETRADALAHVIRTAFEPPQTPDAEVVARAAAELSEVFEDFVAATNAAIYRAPNALD